MAANVVEIGFPCASPEQEVQWRDIKGRLEKPAQSRALPQLPSGGTKPSAAGNARNELRLRERNVDNASVGFPNSPMHGAVFLTGRAAAGDAACSIGQMRNARPWYRVESGQGRGETGSGY